MSPIVASLGDVAAKAYGFFSLSAGFYAGYLADSNAAASQVDYGRGIVFDSSGNAYAVGRFKNASAGTNAFLTKHDSSGVLLWQRSLADSLAAASQGDISWGISIDSSNNLYIVGQFQNASSGTNAFIVKYNSSGTIQWQRSLASSLAAGSQGDAGIAIAIDSSANVYIAGSTTNSGGGSNAIVAKYNSSGTIQWQRKLNDALAAASQDDHGNGIAVDSSGNVYVIGYNSSSTGYYAFIVKYNTSGTLQWQKSLGDAGASKATFGQAIAVDSSANVYVTGQGHNASNGYVAFLVKYDTSGTLQWQRSLAGPQAAATQGENGWFLSIDSSANIYAIGQFKNASNRANVFIAKYNTSGTIQWQRSLADSLAAASQNDIGYCISIDSASNLYLIGQFLNSSSGINTFVAKIPSDGSKTGTITIDANHALTYASSSLTDAAGSFTSAAGALTDSAGAMTDAALSLTDSASSLTYAKVIIP